jgi:hypothetical protein
VAIINQLPDGSARLNAGMLVKTHCLVITARPRASPAVRRFHVRRQIVCRRRAVPAHPATQRGTRTSPRVMAHRQQPAARWRRAGSIRSLNPANRTGVGADSATNGASLECQHRCPVPWWRNRSAGFPEWVCRHKNHRQPRR